MTTVQVYVPGISAAPCVGSARTSAGSTMVGDPAGELPISWFAESTQSIDDFVPPVASDCTCTRRSVSGVSKNVIVSPLYGLSLHFAVLSTVTVWPVGSSRWYPLGAAVSVTTHA